MLGLEVGEHWETSQSCSTRQASWEERTFSSRVQREIPTLVGFQKGWASSTLHHPAWPSLHTGSNKALIKVVTQDWLELAPHHRRKWNHRASACFINSFPEIWRATWPDFWERERERAHQGVSDLISKSYKKKYKRVEETGGSEIAEQVRAILLPRLAPDVDA